MPPPLASSATAEADLLARGFLDALAREEADRIRWGLRVATDPDDPVEPLTSDGPTEIADEIRRPPLRADLAAVAIGLARAMERQPDLIRRLRGEAPVVVIEASTGAIVPLVRRVLTRCALPENASVYGAEIGSHRPEGPAALILAREGGRDDRPDVGNEVVAHARNIPIPLIGIAPDPHSHLPRDLMRIAEWHLALPPLDMAALELIIEAVTGETPTRLLAPEGLRGLTVADLPLAICPDRSADRCIEALECIAAREDILPDGPTLDDLAGYGDAGTWGQELAADLVAYKAGRLSWDEIDHPALLLSGPPGVGKTLFAQALAQTAGVPLIATSVAQWNASKYLSGTLQAIRSVFAEARRRAPCVLFIDEVDGISDRAVLRGEYVEYWGQVINSVLEELAGAEDRPGVVVVAATNYPERLDPALKRAGRLDHEIRIEKPDLPALTAIFRHHLGAALPNDDTVPAAIAALGCTGADVEAFVRRARGVARRAGRALALDDVLDQIRASRPQLGPEARRRIAIHEAGHVVVASILGPGSVVGASLHSEGGVAEVSATLDGTATLEMCERQLAILMAGRAAEALEMDEISIGAGGGDESDLCRATELARAIETQFGLGLTGNAYVPDSQSFLVPGLIDAVRNRLGYAEERAALILTGHRSALQKIADALESKGTLSAQEIKELLSSSEKSDVGRLDVFEPALVQIKGRNP
ncbi:AAA family ATPase [Microvirga sp. Marseille-Q2068]|uniref:AAA family ATPase n=2 Tax=Microvirga mediterraneensis TaxID=2754695 RepID=A0A838BQ30_9HYPH|nr:AAA family ATPase [Microvirga mediterraneensis]